MEGLGATACAGERRIACSDARMTSLTQVAIRHRGSERQQHSLHERIVLSDDGLHMRQGSQTGSRDAAPTCNGGCDADSKRLGCGSATAQPKTASD